ncbi:hypothetical protein QQ045_008490 [Rhodiola kirilowii]
MQRGGLKQQQQQQPGEPLYVPKTDLWKAFDLGQKKGMEYHKIIDKFSFFMNHGAALRGTQRRMGKDIC